MSTTSEPPDLDVLIARLVDDDEDARYRAGQELHKLGRPALERALELARDPQPRLRAMACFVLGQAGSSDPAQPLRYCEVVHQPYREGVPVLMELLRTDPDDEVRAAAAAALGHQEAPSTLPVLVDAASDPSAAVRWDVAFALGSFGDSAWENPEARSHLDAARAALLRLMDDESDDVRDWATFGLRHCSHDTPEVQARLWLALDDRCPEVRGEAAAALAGFGNRAVIPRLERLLREDVLVPMYFEAAECLADPSLLPAVLNAAERWRATMAEGEEMHSCVTSAIETLQREAQRTAAGATPSDEPRP